MSAPDRPAHMHMAGSGKDVIGKMPGVFFIL